MKGGRQCLACKKGWHPECVGPGCGCPCNADSDEEAEEMQEMIDRLEEGPDPDEAYEREREDRYEAWLEGLTP